MDRTSRPLPVANPIVSFCALGMWSMGGRESVAQGSWPLAKISRPLAILEPYERRLQRLR
jgi:hypothetical protein